MPDPDKRKFAELAADGMAVPCAGNLPLDLGDPGSVWFVETGAVDIFLTERLNGVEQTALQLLLRAGTSRLLPGVAPQTADTTLGLMARGLPGTVLRQLSVDGLAGVQAGELGTLVDAWITDVSAALSRSLANQPPPNVLLEIGRTPAAGNTFSMRRGVAWVKVPDSAPGAGLYMDLVEVGGGDDATTALPLTPASWLTLPSNMRLSTPISSDELAMDGRLLPALTNFHALALETERINRMLAIVDQAHLERATATTRRVGETRARRQLLNVPVGGEAGGIDDDASPLAKALRAVGQHEGIRFRWPRRSDMPDLPPELVDILDVSGVRGRRVQLGAIDRWWRGDSGAMLAFRSEGDAPVALLPGVLGQYRIYDPMTDRTAGVTDDCVRSLSGDAWQFYRSLGSSSVRPGDLLRIFGNGLGAGLARFAGTGLAGGLAMLVPAVALGYIANHVIPAGELGLLVSITTGLATLAVIVALIHVLQGMALMRIEGRIASRIEAAFWDRLLRLPLGFLHRYTAGDRAMRGMTFQRLRDAVQGVAANNVLSIIFLLPALLVIFVFDAALGAVTAAFGLVALVLTVTLGLRQVSPYERMIRASHRLTGVLFQFINGIAKLRIDGAEGSAYAVWAQHFGEQQRAELELGRHDAHLRAFGSALPMLAAAVVLAVMALRDPDSLAIGDFLLVYAAFMLFVSGVVRLGASFSVVAAIAPELNQIRPFLAEAPETGDGREPIEFLGGDLTFDRVSFSYDPEGPMILDDVSIHARRGEFIAIAGHSGSGKSTLFRLALGLNEPSAGTVYYDGRDLRQLNVRQLRRKLGAVPQKADLHPQDLWDNIAANQDHIDAEDVWRAARAASVGDEIAQMPMQMLTCVGDNQSVMSGGETQRITIARALARNPRILLLDEATNFLDNENQSRVMDRLANLPVTRIVIAHRLSTLRQADRIYVLDSGKVVEFGTYEELNAAEGVFHELVRRQEA